MIRIYLLKLKDECGEDGNKVRGNWNKQKEGVLAFVGHVIF
jgi:hypothetical protein